MTPKTTRESLEMAIEDYEKVGPNVRTFVLSRVDEENLLYDALTLHQILEDIGKIENPFTNPKDESTERSLMENAFNRCKAEVLTIINRRGE